MRPYSPFGSFRKVILSLKFHFYKTQLSLSNFKLHHTKKAVHTREIILLLTSTLLAGVHPSAGCADQRLQLACGDAR